MRPPKLVRHGSARWSGGFLPALAMAAALLGAAWTGGAPLETAVSPGRLDGGEGAGRGPLLPVDSPRTVIELGAGWKFHQGSAPGASAEDFDDSSWETVALPHTWNGEDGQDGPSTLYYMGEGWYRRRVVPEAGRSGQRVYLRCEGASLLAEVYVNGVAAGRHEGGFTAFVLDVTGLVRFGEENLVAIRVSNAWGLDFPPRTDGRFTLFGGLYRGVSLLYRDPVGISPLDLGSPGVYLQTPEVSALEATLTVRARIDNASPADRNVSVAAFVLDDRQRVVAVLADRRRLAGQSGWDFLQTAVIGKPRLWNGRQDPYLYTVRVEVREGERLADCVSQPLGFRFFRLDPETGFYLNGQPLELYGVNRHQDRSGKGWAISPADHLEDIDLICEMGANMVRLCHYPHATEFYDLCDRRGLVVLAENPVIQWISPSAAYRESAERQLRELIRQQGNHPSICFWGIANEVIADPDPTALLTSLAGIVREEDPGRVSTLAAFREDDPFGGVTDAISFNKYYGWYEHAAADIERWLDYWHGVFAGENLGLTEYGAGAGATLHSTRPVRKDHTEEYQCLVHETVWAKLHAREFLWCRLIWNMFDFAMDYFDEGETAGRNDKGLVSYDRQVRKDAFYWYKANWTAEPFVYLTGRRFVERTEALTEVKVYSNCEWVELRLNGQSLGRRDAPSTRAFVWPGVTLSEGDNLVEAEGWSGGVSCRDSCTWRLDSAAVARPILMRASAGSGRVLLEWNHGDPAVDYEVHWGTASGRYEFSESLPSGSDRRLATLTGLENGTRYFCAVSAARPGGGSAVLSNERTALPFASGSLALGMPAQASSTQVDAAPGWANDGDPGTWWAAVEESYPQWWAVDLGEVAVLAEVWLEFYNRGTPRSYGYRLESSLDGTSWVVLADRPDNFQTGRIVESFSPGGARYLRVFFYGASLGWAHAGLVEVGAFDWEGRLLAPAAADPAVGARERFGAAAGAQAGSW